MLNYFVFSLVWDLKTILESWFLPLSMAYEGGGRPTQPPSLRVPPWEADWGHPWGSSFNITSACIYLPQVRHSRVQRGAVVLLPPCPPGKYKIKRKLRLKSNTWQWQRLRICLNSLLIQDKERKVLAFYKENTSLHKMYYDGEQT